MEHHLPHSPARALAAGYKVWKDGNGWRFTTPRGDYDSPVFRTRGEAWNKAALHQA